VALVPVNCDVWGVSKSKAAEEGGRRSAAKQKVGVCFLGMSMLKRCVGFLEDREGIRGLLGY